MDQDIAGFSPEHIFKTLTPLMTEERVKRLEEVAASRSLRLASVLENIYDHGNVSAVMRSFEAFGFLRMHLVQQPGAKFKVANRVTRGAEKWLDVHKHADAKSCVARLKADGFQIWATDLNTQYSIANIDWSKPTAIVLGNEKDGVSRDMLDLVDGTFRVPMLGFSQSFNISVAAALIFYHARTELEKLPGVARVSDEEKTGILVNYYLRCFDNPERLLGQ